MLIRLRDLPFLRHACGRSFHLKGTGMRKPEFITFTGIDEQTDPTYLRDMARYPVEYGILFSPSKTGVDPRYPSYQSARRFYGSGLRLAAHLCGDFAQCARTPSELPDVLADELFDEISRVQFNVGLTDPSAVIEPYVWRIVESLGNDVTPIVQWQADHFPSGLGTDYLFDASGGRGKRPDGWPAPAPGSHRVGYAGGITPDNVLAILNEIADHHPQDVPYWIDMESGVRSAGLFDPAKALRVLQAVYG